ncbi:hypothetical protein M3A49_18545 [Paraburkholderia sp. CNPSo 3076]|uniref:hypothetical protein n=1 Tax=Paraburkholderia sp. CNPSo 3076 TaxID=2940936 RepID=UPI0022519DF9|nr:hypothetical protein [Paraburkholderia sp. CNPSo 3076]MCX5541474.1 hypothetical protein [Paraburkholderia sp. CNPSo 3076]
MHSRPSFLPFDDDEHAWLPEHPHQEPAIEPPSFRSDINSQAESGRTPCPQCQSAQTEPRHTARRIGGAVGAAAGATGAIALALSGAETGAAVGVLAGPAGAVCGAIAGAVIAGLIGGTAGCATGSVFGEVIDDKVLDNFRCHACGHTFSRHKAST